MTTVEQVKELITKELAPINHEIKALTEKYKELRKSMNYFSDKYDDLLKQIKSTNGAVQNHGLQLNALKQDLKIIDQRAVES